MGNQIYKLKLFAVSPSPEHGGMEEEFGGRRESPTGFGGGMEGMMTFQGQGGKPPCRACTDFKSWAKLQASRKKGDKDNKEQDDKDPFGEGGNEGEILMETKRTHLECPLDKDELGRSSWGLLHTMAAYYPDKPSKTQEKEMSAFIKIFAKYYPCEHCAQDFQRSIKERPPETGSRVGLARWMCGMHNEVNSKLGKPTFDCGKVDERWKDGWEDGSCDDF